jgi:transposase InsO family protein
MLVIVDRQRSERRTRDRPTAPRSPWQNGYAERLIGSIRRECLDNVVVFDERHLPHCFVRACTITTAHAHISRCPRHRVRGAVSAPQSVFSKRSIASAPDWAAARQIEPSRSVHRYSGRTPASLPRIADEIATLYLVDVVVVGVVIVFDFTAAATAPVATCQRGF